MSIELPVEKPFDRHSATLATPQSGAPFPATVQRWKPATTLLSGKRATLPAASVTPLVTPRARSPRRARGCAKRLARAFDARVRGGADIVDRLIEQAADRADDFGRRRKAGRGRRGRSSAGGRRRFLRRRIVLLRRGFLRGRQTDEREQHDGTERHAVPQGRRAHRAMVQACSHGCRQTPNIAPFSARGGENEVIRAPYRRSRSRARSTPRRPPSPIRAASRLSRAPPPRSGAAGTPARRTARRA